jgi:hypothetical protein
LSVVNQVTIVAILMIVQGFLEVGIALLYIVMAFVIPAIFQQAQMQQQGQVGAPPGLPAGFAELMTGIYGAMGAAGFFAGVLRVVAGFRNIRYRGRVFGIISMIFGLLSLATCYCSVTSVGLLIYGMIVYLNRDVIRAFELGERGVPSDEIKARHYLASSRTWRAPGDHPDEAWRDDEQPGRDVPPLKGDEFRPTN